MSRENEHLTSRVPIPVLATAIVAMVGFFLLESAGILPSLASVAIASGVSGGLVRALKDRMQTRPRIARPPTYWLDRVARFFWSRKTYERVFAPLKADLVHEWMQAEAAGQRRKAWYIKWIRGPFTQLAHMVNQVPWSIAKRLVEMVRAAME
jgi:hypothetical protein